MQFTDPSWTPRRVKIEAQVLNAWTASLDTRDNTNTIVATKFRPLGVGIEKVRFTLGTPANEAYVRISKIFGYDYQGVGSATEARSGNYYIEKYVDSAHYSSIRPAVDSVYNLGTTDLRYGNVFSDVLNTHNITASSDISASGNLYAKLTNSDDTTFDAVVYDNATGRFYTTGSFGGGGGSVAAGSNINISGVGNNVVNLDNEISIQEVTASHLHIKSSSIFDGTFLFTGFDFTVQNAATFSGSNVFGSGSDASLTTHKFTGSVSITGSSLTLQDSDIIFTGDPTIRTSDNSSLTIEPEGTLSLGNGSQTDSVQIGRMSGGNSAGRTEIYAHTSTPAVKFTNQQITFNHPITASTHVFAAGDISSSATIFARDIQIGRNNDSASVGELKIYKDTNRQAIIHFPRHSSQNMNDDGYIRHWEETQDKGYMDFKVSDNRNTTDQFRFGYGGGPSGPIGAGIIMDTTGRIRTSGSIQAGVLGSNPADITATRDISATAGTGSFKKVLIDTNSFAETATSLQVGGNIDAGTNVVRAQRGKFNTINNRITGNDIIEFDHNNTVNILGPITASTHISASGALFASLSLDSSNFNTVMYDTATGRFYYTGSYGGGGGGIVTGDGEWDGTRDGDSQITGSLVISGSGNTELTVEGNINISTIENVQNVIRSDGGFKFVSGLGSSDEDIQYLYANNNVLQWRSNGDAEFQLKSHTSTNAQTLVNFHHQNGGPAHFSVGTSQDDGSFIISRASDLSSNKHFVITGSNGYVGIQELNPLAPLHVNGQTRIDGQTRIGGDLAIGPQGNIGPVTGYTLSIRDTTPNIIFNDQTGTVGTGTIEFRGESAASQSDFIFNATSGSHDEPPTYQFQFHGNEIVRFNTSSVVVTGDVSASGNMHATSMSVQFISPGFGNIDNDDPVGILYIQGQDRIDPNTGDGISSNIGGHVKIRGGFGQPQSQGTIFLNEGSTGRGNYSNPSVDIDGCVDINVTGPTSGNTFRVRSGGQTSLDIGWDNDADETIYRTSTGRNLVFSGSQDHFKFKNTVSVESSGSTIFEVIGSQGQLFSITDQLSGSLFGVSDVSGLPLFEVFSDGNVVLGKYADGNVSSSYNSTASFGVYYGDGSHLTGVTGDSGVESFGFNLVDSTDVVNIFHSLDSEFVSITVYTGSIATNDKRQIIPKEARVIANDQIRLEFDRPTTGDVVIHRGGNIVSGSAFSYRQTIGPDQLLGSPHPDYSYDIQHNLNELYPIVQFYTSSADGYPTQMIPRAITSINANQVRLEFDTPMNGTIVVKR